MRTLFLGITSTGHPWKVFKLPNITIIKVWKNADGIKPVAHTRSSRCPGTPLETQSSCAKVAEIMVTNEAK